MYLKASRLEMVVLMDGTAELKVFVLCPTIPSERLKQHWAPRNISIGNFSQIVQCRESRD